MIPAAADYTSLVRDAKQRLSKCTLADELNAGVFHQRDDPQRHGDERESEVPDTYHIGD
jgi:hypothetical protein